MSLNVGQVKKELSPNNQRPFALGDVELVKSDPPYADPPKQKQEGKKASEVRDKFAPNREKPTTASAEPGTKDLPSVLKKVDPSNLSSILPSMFSLLSMINSTMNSSSQSSRKVTIEDSLTGALAILNQKYGYGKVILAFTFALKDNQIEKIDAVYRDIVKNALANFIKSAIENGPANIPVRPIPNITYTLIIPTPIVLDDEVPSLSLQQYYTADRDPYPGYIQWLLPEGTLSSTGSNFVYTRRTSDQPPYESADEEIYSISERELAAGLDPYVRDQTLTAEILNDLLATQDTNVQNNGMDRTVGKNSAANLMSLLGSILGVLGAIINTTKSNHLPQSVLNQGSVNQSLEKYSQNMAMLKNMKQNAEMAFKPTLPINGLPNLNSVLSGISGGLLSQLAPNIAGISNIVGNINNINVATLVSATGLNVSSAQNVVNQVQTTRQLLGIITS
jgi:hypothetical protein